MTSSETFISAATILWRLARALEDGESLDVVIEHPDAPSEKLAPEVQELIIHTLRTQANSYLEDADQVGAA